MLVLNEDQVMLQDAAKGFVQEKAPVAALRRLRDDKVADGFDRGLWREMAEMGWTGVLVPEDQGGLGFGFVGAGVLCEEMGRTRGFWWGPDGRRLLVSRVDVSPVDVWHVASPVEPWVEPHAMRYPAAGTSNANVGLSIVGLDAHQPVADHELAARRSRMARAKRIVVIADEGIEEYIERRILALGATGYSVIPCEGVGRNDLTGGGVPERKSRVRIEVITLEASAGNIIAWLRQDVFPCHRVTVSVESVEVIRRDHFVAQPAETRELEATAT